MTNITHAPTCKNCGGKGSYFVVPQGMNPFFMGAIAAAQAAEERTCPTCNGTGRAVVTPRFAQMLREMDEAGAKLDATLADLKADPLFPSDDDSRPEPTIPAGEGLTALVVAGAANLGIAMNEHRAARFAEALYVAGMTAAVDEVA